jgi:hypothetical protein
MSMALRNEFPDCCGADCVFNFYTYGDKDKFSLGRFYSGRVYLAILAEYQLKDYQPMLLKAKFRLISDNVVNKNSGNRLYVYIRDPKTRLKKVRKSAWR